MAKQWWGVLAAFSATVCLARPVGLYIGDENKAMRSRANVEQAIRMASSMGFDEVYMVADAAGFVYFQTEPSPGVTVRLPNSASGFMARSIDEAVPIGRAQGVKVIPWMHWGLKTPLPPAGSPMEKNLLKNLQGGYKGSEANLPTYAYLNIHDPEVRKAYIDRVVQLVKNNDVSNIVLDDNFTIKASQFGKNHQDDLTKFAIEINQAIRAARPNDPEAGIHWSINPAAYSQRDYNLDILKIMEKGPDGKPKGGAKVTIQDFRHRSDGTDFFSTVFDEQKLLKAHGIPFDVAVTMNHLSEDGQPLKDKSGKPRTDVPQNRRENVELVNEHLQHLARNGVPLGAVLSIKDLQANQGIQRTSLKPVIEAFRNGKTPPTLAYTAKQDVLAFGPEDGSAGSAPTVIAASLPTAHYAQAGKAEISAAPTPALPAPVYITLTPPEAQVEPPTAHIAMAPADQEPKLPQSEETPVHTVPVKQSYKQLEQKAFPSAPVAPAAAAPDEVPQATGHAPLPGTVQAEAAAPQPAPASARASSAHGAMKVAHSQPRSLDDENARRALAQEQAHAAAEAKMRKAAQRAVCDSGKPILECLRTLEAGTYSGINDKGESCTLVVSYETNWMFRTHSQPLVHFLLYNDRDRVTQWVPSGTKTLKRDVFKNNEFAEFTIGQDVPDSAPVPLPQTGTISKVMDAFRTQADGSKGQPMPRPSVEGSLAAQGQFTMEIEEQYYRFKAVTPRWVENNKLVRNVTGKEEVQLDRKKINVGGRIANNRVDSLVIAAQDSPTEVPKNLDCHGLRLARDGAPLPGAAATSSGQH